MQKKLSKEDLKKRLIRQVGLVLIIGLAYGVGYLSGHANLILENNYQPKFVNTSVGQPKNTDFSLFWSTYNEIQANSLNKLDPKKALDGAISGMVDSLGDPYSVYMNKSQSTDFMDVLDNKFEGIGAELTINENQLTVVSPLPDSPASKAGLKPKDKILKIDNKDTNNMDLSDAVDLIRGKAGSKVNLTVQTGEEPARELAIVRQAIKADSVTMSTVGDNVALIRISQFSDDTAGLMDQMAQKIIKNKSKGVIIDLRNNPGGLLDASVSSSSLFLDDKTVVIEQDNSDKKQIIKTNQKAILKDIPLTILVNGGSASASEIMAGAMQDWGRAQIIGETSYGKGTVQELIPLQKSSTLRLTIAQWLTPQERAINHKGITPDIKITDDPKTDQDEVISKALEVMKLK